MNTEEKDSCCCCCGHDHHEHEHGHHHEHHHEHEHHEHEHHEQEHQVRSHQPTDEKKVFLLENLGCANCAAKMEARINQLSEISEATITFATKKLCIYGTDLDHVLPKIQNICASIESEVKVVPAPETSQARPKTSDESSDNSKKKPDSELMQIISGAILFALAIILGKLTVQPVVPIILFVISYLILGRKVLVQAVKNITHGQVFDENFLMSIATIGAFCIKEFPEAVGVMLFYRIGEYFEDKAVEKSRSQIMNAVDMRPEVVNLISGTEITELPAEQAQIGDLLLIRPGDRIPLDGIIMDGDSRLDTSPITGEPVPISVKTGDSILSGCVNLSGQLKLRVEKTLSESMVTRILDSVENAAASKPKIDRFITRFARIYTPCVVIAALAIAILPSLISRNWYYWIYTALTFLVMSCPCALVLSVPLAFFSGIGAGSRKGILFKGGLAMESLSKLGAVIMDKTGTITKGDFRLQEIVNCGTLSENELLSICAGCEMNSTHPIAVSIVQAARERYLEFHAPLQVSESAGHGIIAHTAEGEVLCGNQKLMQEHHIALPAMLGNLYGSEVFLAINHTFQGYLIISDTVKPDAKESIEKLKSLGLHTVMLTGDSENSAQAVADQTGIQEVHAKLLPVDKLHLLQSTRAAHGSVMFVGDGINDAPVLAGADVGAAMGSGADAAIEAADTVFMTSSVASIPQAIRIARSTNRIALQNVVIALAIKIFVMILGLTGHANMWMAVFADTGVAIICVLNSIRALYIK